MEGNKTSKDWHKRKKEKAEALAREEAQLTERGNELLGRLGCGGSKVLDDDDDDGDKYGGRLEKDDYRAGAAALAALQAKKVKTPADKEAIGKAVGALSAIRRRACKKVEAEKAEQRVEALRVRVAKLDAELGALSNP